MDCGNTIVSASSSRRGDKGRGVDNAEFMRAVEDAEFVRGVSVNEFVCGIFEFARDVGVILDTELGRGFDNADCGFTTSACLVVDFVVLVPLPICVDKALLRMEA